MEATLKKLLKPARMAHKRALVGRRIRRILDARQPICLDVGAGDKKGTNGWLTLDITLGCDIYCDVRRGMPFPDASVSRIYTSHFLEHLTYTEGQAFLAECLRVLISGGEFSICVPNARLYIEAYLHGTQDLDAFMVYRPAVHHTTRIDYVNYTAYMDGHHKYMFDEENLIHILRAKGLRNVRLREFDPALDRQNRHFESIYAVGER